MLRSSPQPSNASLPTSEPPPQPAVGTVAAASPWLYNAGADLMLGAGLIYLPILGALWLAGPTVQSWLPAALMPLYALAFSTPHVGATLLRVYERPEDRQKYRLFAVYATGVLALGFLVGLYVGWVGSLLITLYLSVVPWHFTAQNYGVAMVFLRRRGIELEPNVKRLIYLTFIFCYLATLASLHGATSSEGYAPLETSGTIYTFLSLGLPVSVASLLIMSLGFGYLACMVLAGEQLIRRYPIRDLLPLVAVLLVQALWYVLPLSFAFLAAGGRTDPLAPGNFAYTFFWVSIVHSLQYLWITAYMRRRQGHRRGRDLFVGRALVWGAAIYGLPVLLLAPSALGTVPYDAGLFLMIAGALNLHHVMLDSAIWKLRDGRLASILLRPTTDVVSEGLGVRWFQPAVVVAGLIGATFIIVGTLELSVAVPDALERRDLARLETASDRLSWMGRQNASVLAAVGTLRAESGNMEGAVDALAESINLLPSGSALYNMGSVLEKQGELDGALRAYRGAAIIDKDDPEAYERARQQVRRLSNRLHGALTPAERS